MSTILGPRFGAGFTGRPTRMSPEDFEIFRRYFPTIKDSIEEVYFDVGLGRGTPPPPMATEAYKRMWTRNTQKRADVVIRAKSGKVLIIEIRFAASSNAIGRLLTYRELYKEDPVLGSDIQIVLVTNQRDDDVARIAARTGIEYVVI